MSSFSRYAAVTAAFLLAAVAVSAFGFSIAADLAASSAPKQGPRITLAAANLSTPERPISELLGEKQAAARGQVDGTSDWVEVVDDVNMRSGPSSVDAVVKVQLAGAKLRVASRQGKWVQVVEPDSGGAGWVFEAFVKSIPSAARHAGAAGTAMR